MSDKNKLKYIVYGLIMIAIIIGIFFFLKNNKSKNIPIDNEIIGKPVYILDSQLRTPLNARVFTTAALVTLLHDVEAPLQKKQPFEAHQVRCHQINADHSGLNLQEILAVIGQDGIHDLWIEAGGRCFQSFWEQGLIHRALIYQSSKMLGEKGKPAFSPSFSLLKFLEKTSFNSYGADRLYDIPL